MILYKSLHYTRLRSPSVHSTNIIISVLKISSLHFLRIIILIKFEEKLSIEDLKLLVEKIFTPCVPRAE